MHKYSYKYNLNATRKSSLTASYNSDQTFEHHTATFCQVKSGLKVQSHSLRGPLMISD